MQNAIPRHNPQTLQVYLYYRLALSGLLVVMFYSGIASSILGTSHPKIYLYCSLAYFTFSLASFFVFPPKSLLNSQKKDSDLTLYRYRGTTYSHPSQWRNQQRPGLSAHRFCGNDKFFYPRAISLCLFRIYCVGNYCQYLLPLPRLRRLHQKYFCQWRAGYTGFFHNHSIIFSHIQYKKKIR